MSKKQLKVNGSSIVSFAVQVKKIKGEHGDALIDIVDLEINTDDDVYKYDLRKDERAPDVYITRDYINDSLEKAKDALIYSPSKAS